MIVDPDRRSLVTVFGGTGFLGRRLVAVLLARGVAVRSVSRHPRPSASGDGFHTFAADVHDDAAVAAAVSGATAVVNVVSLYVERGTATFRSVHVAAAERIAGQALRAGVRRLVQLSGIGADAASDSPYIRSRGEGEQAVRAAFPAATLVRPAVLVGPHDAFLASLRTIVRRLPVIPLFGRGGTWLQPVHVADVAEAVARILDVPAPAPIYEFGGPRAYRYADLLRLIAREAGVRRLFVPVPFGLWHAAASFAEHFPGPPLTRSQVELMRLDTRPAPDRPGLPDLGVAPRGLECLLQRIAAN